MPILVPSTIAPIEIVFPILIVLIVLAYFVVSRFRDYVAGDQATASEALSNLREMLRKGEITDEEFRTIQACTQQPRSGALTNDPHLNISPDVSGETPPSSPTDTTEHTECSPGVGDSL